MKSPEESSNRFEPGTLGASAEDVDFERELANLEQTVDRLKGRYAQIQQDQQTQTQLVARKTDLAHQLSHTSTPELKRELAQVQDKLDELEINLESRLFSLSSLKEPFWQIMRFGGLGIIVGWSLAFCTLQQPKPQPPSGLPPRQSVQP